MLRVAVGKGTGGQGTTSLAAAVVSPYITEPKRQQNQTSCPDSQEHVTPSTRSGERQDGSSFGFILRSNDLNDCTVCGGPQQSNLSEIT